MFNSYAEIKNQKILLPVLKEKRIELVIKREDLIHPFVSGNKFRKLKYNLKKAQELNHTTILTFGGAYSNHIAATAAACKVVGLKSIGIIRGEELGIDVFKTLRENTTLREAVKNGMQLLFVSREEYRNKNSEEFHEKLQKEFGSFYLVPEGGTNELAVKGCEEILTFEDEKFDYICCAVGTGGTISGLINSAKPNQKIIGFPALKGDFLNEEIKKYTKKDNWKLEQAYHFGGYGKFNETLVDFINDFKEQTKIPLDPVYTGKMIYGIIDMARNNQLPQNSKILAIHTGGLQGIEGANEKLKRKGLTLIK